MSFGFSIGDFVSLGQLTWSLYRACNSAPSSFLELSRELNSLHTILLEFSDEAGSPTSLLNRRGAARKEELDGLIDNLREVLTEIDEIVKRYGSLARDQKKVWERVGFASHDLGELRGRLQIHVGSLQLFMQSLSVGSLGRIEVVLDELVRDIRAGRRERSMISCAEEEDDDADEVAWDVLERELVGEGITIQDVRIHRVDIKEYLIKLIQGHTMENKYSSETSSNTGIKLKGPQLNQHSTSSGHFNTQNLEPQITIQNSDAVPLIRIHRPGPDLIALAERAGVSPFTMSSSGLMLTAPSYFKPTLLSLWDFFKLPKTEIYEYKIYEKTAVPSVFCDDRLGSS